jgi:hypothetical protein
MAKYYRSNDPAKIRKGVQFNIDPLVWEKFVHLAAVGDGENRPCRVSDLVVDLISDYCAMHFDDLDKVHDRKFPNLIGR